MLNKQKAVKKHHQRSDLLSRSGSTMIKPVDRVLGSSASKTSTAKHNRGSLYARKESDFVGVRGTTRAILLTGGLEVHKDGMVLVKADGFASSWKKRLLSFDQGLLKIFDPLLIKGLTGAQQMRLDEYAEEILNVVELRDITYEKRKAKTFSLIFRASAKHKSDKPKTKSLAHSFFSSSVVQNDIVFHFKAINGTECQDWVQSILYEVRNQANFIDRTIAMLLDKSPEEIDTIDGLYRQSVDLWVLAKGKVSKETSEAVKRFCTFLEGNLVEEAAHWKEILSIIDNMLAEKVNEKNQTVLAELQRLNEEEYHKDGSKSSLFIATLNQIKEHGILRRSKKNKNKYAVFQPEDVGEISNVEHTDGQEETNRAILTAERANAMSAAAAKNKNNAKRTTREKFARVQRTFSNMSFSGLNSNLSRSPKGGSKTKKEQIEQKKETEAKVVAQKYALDLGFKSAVDLKEEKETHEDKEALIKAVGGDNSDRKPNQLHL